MGRLRQCGIVFLSFLTAFFFTGCSQIRANRVLATVNGEPIYEKDVVVGMPKDAFSAGVTGFAEIKLGRLITTMSIKQFLAKNGIIVPEKVIDADIEDMKKNPPSAGCMCCRYKSLQQYMDVNSYTMEELRADVRNNEGLQIFTREEWEHKYLSQSERSALVKSESYRIKKDYIRLWHVFFNTFQNISSSADPIGVKKAAADLAWERLKKGEPFESVVKAMSDDMVSRDKGGSLGCISREVFGTMMRDAMNRLRPGEFSGPLQSIWGYHIIKCAPMNDDDVLEVLKREYMDSRLTQLYDDVMRKAVVKRMTQSNGYD